MKKILGILLIFILIFSFTACSEKRDNKTENIEVSKEEVVDDTVVIEEDLLLDFETVPNGVIAKSIIFSTNHFSVGTIYVYEDKIEIWHTDNKKENSKLIDTFNFDGKLLKLEIDKLESNPEFIIYEDDILLEVNDSAIVVYNEKLSNGVKVNYTGVHAYGYRENSKQAERISQLFTEQIINNKELGVYSRVIEIIG